VRTPQQPLVSIVIPCYQQAHYLEEAIESVLAQTYPHYEIIVVDDGSPDDTAAVAARYPPVRYIRQKNQGLAAARNTGLRASQGAYLTFLDADDRLTPGALARGVSCLTEHPEAGLVFGCYRKINAQGELLPTCPPAYAGSDLYHDLLKFNCIGMVCNVMYRRAVFDRLGGFDPNISPAADYDLYLRVALPHSRHQHVAQLRRDAARRAAWLAQTTQTYQRSA
jgi:glycosyltransferase involved in cell wall biosynthesis